jgi:hypothetical protein
MQSPTTTNSSTSSASSQPIVGEPSSLGHSAQTAASSTRSRGSRTQTKWPEDKLTATGLDANHYVKTGFGNGRRSPLVMGNAPVTDQALQISQER